MKKIFVTLLILCWFITPAQAADPVLADVIATLETSYAGLKDLQASFAQSTSLAGFPKAQKGHGELALRRPAGAAAQFRFDYAQPKQSIISNGKQVWFYQPDSKQVMVSSVEGMFKGGNNIALSYLTGLGNVSKDFSAAFGKEPRDRKGNFLLELIPLKPTPVLTRLRLTISTAAVDRYKSDGTLTDTFPIISSLITDASGNQTRIDYSRIRVNSGLGSTKFNFKVPEGVELIKP